MTDHEDVEHRSHFEAEPGDVEVRQPDGEDGVFRIRLPVTSTAEARDGEAFTRDRLEAWREQIDAGDIAVFLDHGRNEATGHRYSVLGKIGYWDNPELRERSGETELWPEAVIADPDRLEDDVGEVREWLAWLKRQAELGFPLSTSAGWSEDTGERDVPGDSDLLEISIVGIPSDPRTTTTASAEPAAMARAVSAASEEFDLETFKRELRKLERAEYEVNGETVTIDPPDAVANAATVALAKDDELKPDCGTGEGRQSARMIADDDVGPERIDDIAAYLTSHEEDVTADGPPSDWSDEEWQDCGNLQYALWGGTGTGTGLEWAQETANDVARAKDEEVPYPERAADEDTMTEDTTEPDEESGDTTDEQRADMEAMMEQMVDMQEEQTNMIREMYENAMDGDKDDGEGDDEEDDGGEESADADESDERMVTLDGEEVSAREAVEDLREQLDEDPDAEAPETQDRGEAEGKGSEETETTTGGFGMAARQEG